MNSIQKIQEEFKKYLAKSYNPTDNITSKIVFTLNVDEQRQQFGDISTNAALILSKQLGQKPHALAQTIADTFKHPLINQITVAGPGFLNIHVNQEVYAKLLEELYTQKDTFFKDALTAPKNYNIEFVSANPTGPLHIGHGRGGIIGDVLGNILIFIGQNATKEFYINDAGSQIEKLGLSFKARCLHELGIEMALPEDGYQGEYLIDLAKTCIKEFGKDITQKPDSFFAEYAKNKLLAEQQETLKQFGITFDTWFSENTLHKQNKINDAIKILEQHGYIYEHEQALWFKATAFGDDKDRVLRKSDGLLTYVASDLAYMLNKVQRGANNLIIVLGQDHHGYVNRMQGLHKALGLEKQPLEIILYQLVSLKEDGQQVRMSKRAGRIVSLRDVVETVGTDVARFFFLNRKADAHLEFDLDLALKKTDENPVYYIQYAYVRINSIIKKTQEIDQLINITAQDAQAITSNEHLLIKKILALKELLHDISTNYHTHQLTYYALELAQVFHSYYSKNKVIDLENIPQSRARLLVLMQLQMTFNLTLKLLGLSRPEKM